jgi:release factor glutamine methyltransferase
VSERRDADGPDDVLVAQLRAAGCVFAEDEAAVLRSSAHGTGHLDEMTARRIAGEPLEHVVGWAELCGVRIGVEPGVFVPRQRSALLVSTAAALVAPGDVVIDVCCGSGGLGLVLATLVPGVVVRAYDVDPVAVACAQRNLRPVGGSAGAGDLFDTLPEELHGTAAAVIANVPYVATRDLAMLPREARDHEPAATLDGGEDGLDVARRVVAEAREWLRPKGSVLVETTDGQAPILERWAREHGGAPRTLTDDDLGATVVATTYG